MGGGGRGEEVVGPERRLDGRMSIDGVRLAARRGRGFFRRVQMVFQDPYGSLHPRQTVDRALAEPLLVHGITTGRRGSSARWPKSRCPRPSAFATRINCPVASASASRSPEH